MNESLDILLVEDNPADVRLTREAFHETGLSNSIRVAVDGEAALGMLQRTADEENRELPGLILLDLNLPGLSGHEVLQEIKSHECLKRIPVMILSSSDSRDDIIKSYDNHANCYICKPTDLTGLIDLATQIEKFWQEFVVLPEVA